MAIQDPSPKATDTPRSPTEHPGQAMDAPAGTLNPPVPAGATSGVAAVPLAATPLSPPTGFIGYDEGGQSHQVLKISSGVPIAGLIDVLGERYRQMVQFGHTPDADAKKSLFALYGVVSHYAKGTLDHLSTHGARSTIRKYAVKQAAALIAFIDRIDAEDAANG